MVLSIHWNIIHTYKGMKYNMDEPWKHYAKWRKPDTKGHILYNSIYMKLPGKSIEIKSRLVVAMGWGWGNGEWIGMRLPLEVLNMFWSYTAVRVAQFCEYTKNHYIYTSKGKIIWYVNYISIFKNKMFGLPWQSSGWDPVLPLLGARVWSLVGKLRSYKLHGMAKKIK